MAATMNLRQSATVLTIRKVCASVNRTDQKKRLPTITSDEIESIFDTANLNAELRLRAA